MVMVALSLSRKSTESMAENLLKLYSLKLYSLKLKRQKLFILKLMPCTSNIPETNVFWLPGLLKISGTPAGASAGWTAGWRDFTPNPSELP